MKYVKQLQFSITVTLIISTGFFIKYQVLPCLMSNKKMTSLLLQEREHFFQLQTKLSQIKPIEDSFAKQWLPKQFEQSTTLCNNDTAVISRFYTPYVAKDFIIQQLNISKQNYNDFGYVFAVKLSGTYTHLIQFFEHLERSFCFFKINYIEMYPKPSDKRYKGIIQANIEGWLW